MITFKVLLEYDGSKYSGWQDQKNARTVMGELRKAARQVFQTDVDMQGAGRTDAGVHALGQVMHIKVAAPIPLLSQEGRPPRSASPTGRSLKESGRGGSYGADIIRKRMNDLLPADVVILDIEQTARNFHARHDASTRTYLYQISTRKQAFMKRYVWWIKEPLNLKAMHRAAEMLRGRHDFVCFRAEDPSRPDESTIVVVENASIETEEEIITFRIEASHFLWRMVRRVVGVLVKIGTGEITEHDLQKLLEGKCSPKLDVAAWTAPASGLFLEHVRYPE